jgi:hypothetical protein
MEKKLIFLQHLQTALGHTLPPVEWVLLSPSPVLRRPERKADESHPFITDVKNA